MKPFVGQDVHYYIKGMPQGGYLERGAVTDPDAWSGPFAAKVVKVVSPAAWLVNLTIHNDSGGTYSMLNVLFFGDREEAVRLSGVDRYCTPMPKELSMGG